MVCVLSARPSLRTAPTLALHYQRFKWGGKMNNEQRGDLAIWPSLGHQTRYVFLSSQQKQGKMRTKTFKP